MTDQTKCPHCGAVFSCIDSTGRYYTCGTSIHDTATHQSDVCALRQLRAKVAAQQELLRHVRGNLLGYQSLGAPELVRRIEDLLGD